MDRTIGIEDLLNEAGWLRRLAASLVGDGAQADDLVQDTWVAALRHPPRADGEKRPWLARVARNLAGNARRERARREERERMPREEPPQPDPESLAQEAEAQRLLAEAVTRLPEPLRAVIVLRYFQGLDSSAVAARLGVSASTVRTRLQRALEDLRADLDRHCEGGRRAWGLLLVPLLRETSPSAVVLASWPVWIACGAAACALVVVGVKAWAPEGVWEGASTTAIATVSEAPVLESIPLSSDMPAGRERVAGSSPNALAAAPAGGEVSGVLRIDGRPPEWPIRLSLEPMAPARQPELVVEPDGRGEFRFEGLSSGWSGRLHVDDYLFADGGSSVVLGTPTRGLVLELRSGPAIVGTIRSPDGLPVPGLEGMYQLDAGKECDKPIEVHMEVFLVRADGAFRLPLRTSAECGIATIRVEAEGRGFLQHGSGRFTIKNGIDLGELVLEPLRPLEFVVRDPDGAPIEGAFARVDGPGMHNAPIPLTGPDGSGLLAVVPDRVAQVRFGAFAHRDRVVSAAPGEPLEVVLEPLASLDVRFGRSAARLRVSADRSAFVWDDDGWSPESTLWFESRGTRPFRRSSPVAPGQRFEYDFHAYSEGRLELVGVRPDVELTVEAFDLEGSAIVSRVVSVASGRRVAVELE